MAATPMHAANSKAVKARTGRLPINRRWPGTWTVLTAAGRNVAALPGFVEEARSMSKKRFANVWDAIEDIPAQGENMKLRSPERASEIESDHCGRGAL